MNNISFTSIKHVTGSPENCEPYKNEKLPEDYMKAVIPLNDLYGKKDAATEEYGVFDGKDAAKLYKDLLGLEVPEVVVGKPTTTALKDLWHKGKVAALDFEEDFRACKKTLKSMVEDKSGKLKEYWENCENKGVDTEGKEIEKINLDKNKTI